MDDEKKTPSRDKGLPWVKVLATLAVVLTLVATAISIARFVPITKRYYTDAGEIREPADRARVRDVLWQPPRPLSEFISTSVDDYEPRLSADGLTLFFVRGKAGENADIYASLRTPAGWTEPESLADVNTDYDELGPEPSPDGQSLFFYSDRPGGSGGYDLWVAHRSRRGWQEAVNLGPLVNSELNDYGPTLTPDGTTLYFASNRPTAQDSAAPSSDAWPATVGEEMFQRDYDLYASTLTDAGATMAKPLTALNSPYNEGAPAVSSFGDFLYFASDRPDGFGGFDLYRSWRVQGELRPPLNLGAAVNSPANELDPGLSLGGYALYFSSDRVVLIERVGGEEADATADGEASAAAGQAEYNLYHTTSREVFTEIEQLDRGAIDWAALWRAIAPNLLWALIALALLVAMLMLLRDARARRLSLLAKCLLASLMAHLLMLLLFNVWEVTASLAHEFNRKGRIQIALASPSVENDLARQIRGPMTDIEVPSSVEPETQPLATQDSFEPFTVHAELSVDQTKNNITDTTPMEVAMHDADVQHPLEDPASLTPPVADTSVEPIDASLPQTPRKTFAPEPARSRPSTPRLTESVDRPQIETGMAQSSGATAQLAPVAGESHRAASTLDNNSLADSWTAREPLPETSAAKIADVPAALDQPRVMDMSLPAAPVNRPQATREPTVHLAGRVLPTPRIEVSATSVADAQRTRVAQLDPTMQQAPIGDTSYVASAALQALDATPLVAAVEQVNTGAMAAPAASLAQVALTPLETSPAGGETEEPVSAPPAEALTTRRSLAMERLASSSRLSMAALTPEARAVDSTKTSLLDDSTSRLTDAAHRPSVEPIERTPQVQPSISPLSELALPKPVQTAWTREAQRIPYMPRTKTTSIRRSPATQTPVNERAEDLATLSPAGTAARMAEASLLKKNAIRLVDATLRPSGGLDSVPPQWSSPLPPLDDLALPAMQQSKPVMADETGVAAVAAADYVPRAELPASASSALGSPSTLPAETRLAALNYTANAPSKWLDVHDRDATPLSPTPTTAMPLPRRDDFFAPDRMLPDLSLPREQQAPSNPYVQRTHPQRLDIVKRHGGSEATEQAVANALRWLAAHQSEDGHWDGDRFDDGCGECDGQTDIVVDNALTGLALLSFYGAGHTHVADGPYRNNVERGLRWLLKQQKPDGDLRGPESMYSHGIATIAISEAFGMSRDSALAQPVARAAFFIDRVRNRTVGGWRYDPGQAGDTSVLGWQVMALKSAAKNGIPVPTGSFRAAREWMRLVSSPSKPGLYSYQPEQSPTPSMTAEGMFIQQLLGVPRDDPRMDASARYILEYPPQWESEVNTYFWYYATLALFQHQGPFWKSWNGALTRELLDHQRTDGKTAGSWDPVGEWADLGGRVYQTALCTLMLEVYYRYLPMYANDPPIDPIGAIRGFVTDAATGELLSGVTVQLDLPDRNPIIATTGEDGSYLLLSPEMPDFFALSASRKGYIPSTANVASEMVKGTTLPLDFALQREGLETVVIEPIPEVHHLGDNNFEGRINSQFQKESEGSEFKAEFALNPMQLPPHISRAEVRLLAKGVQRRHTIRINSTSLKRRLEDAPRDGSFGPFSAPFDPDLLREGVNTIEIIARPSSVDIDDFEFVNVQIQLFP